MHPIHANAEDHVSGAEIMSENQGNNLEIHVAIILTFPGKSMKLQPSAGFSSQPI